VRRPDVLVIAGYDATGIVAEGVVMTHVWIGRRFLPERYGCQCKVLVAIRGKFLLEFGDGLQVATVRGTFRRLKGGDA